MDTSIYEVTPIPLTDIFSDSDFNCRGEILPIDIIDLSKDIERRGLDSPIVLQYWELTTGKKYRIVAGHRRYAAFQLLNHNPELAGKFDKIPAFVRGDLDEFAARALNFRENLHRQNLNIVQEARAMNYYVRFNYKDKDIAEILGQSSGWVQVRKALNTLPEDIKEQAAAGFLTQEQIKAAARIKDRDRLYEYVRAIKMKKEKGEKVDILPPMENKNVLWKSKNRSQAELNKLKLELYEKLGPNILTRLLAWATADISTVSLYQDIEKYALEQGIPYEIPEDVTEAMNTG